MKQFPPELLPLLEVVQELLGSAKLLGHEIELGAFFRCKKCRLVSQRLTDFLDPCEGAAQMPGTVKNEGG